MNIWDMIVAIIILAAFIWAISRCVISRKNGGNCCGRCEKCSGCLLKKGEQQDE